MKSHLPIGLLSMLAFFVAVGGSPAQTITNEGALDGLSTMPGSLDDFSFYGNPANFPGDNYYFAENDTTGVESPQPSLLTNFTESEGDFQYIDGGQTGTYSVINVPNPGGSGFLTGSLFGGNTNANYGGQNTEFDAVNYTLAATTPFNSSNFNVYVMFSNNPGQTGFNDSAITLTLVSPAGSSMDVQTVSDTNSGLNFPPNYVGNTSVADFAEFNVQGAVNGDVLEIGYVGNFSRYGDLGGVSFESVVPEPSTYALLFAGLGLLAFVGRLRSKLTV